MGDSFDEEVEALGATFPELTRPAPRKVVYTCSARAGTSCVVQADLVVTSSLDYPVSSLGVDLVAAKGATGAEIEAALNVLRKMSAELRGELSCFAIFLAAQNEMERLADAILCCICLEPIRGGSDRVVVEPVALSACGHCLHSHCLAQYASRLIDMHVESESYQASLRASRQAASAAEEPLRRARVELQVLLHQLEAAQARSELAADESANLQIKLDDESPSSCDARSLSFSLELSRKAEASAAAAVKSLRKDVIASEARIRRATSEFDAYLVENRVGYILGDTSASARSTSSGRSTVTGAATSASVIEANVVIICPLCRCPLTPDDSRAAIAASKAVEKLERVSFCEPSAAVAASADLLMADAPVPLGLEPETVILLRQFRARHMEAYRRQREGRCFWN